MRWGATRHDLFSKAVPWAAFSFAAFLLLAGCGSSVSREINATVLKAEGGSFLTGNQRTGEGPLQPASQVGLGATIHTGNVGRVAILLLPGALIEIEPNSALVVEQLKINKDGNPSKTGIERNVRLRLLEGTIVALLEFEPRPADWRIITPEGGIVALSTGLCRVEVSLKNTRLTSVRGKFVFQNPEANSESGVRAGYVYELPSTKGAPFPAEENAISQQDLQKSLELERILLDLQRRERFSSYPWHHQP